MRPPKSNPRGPKWKAQLNELGLSWKQGQHVLVTGSTGSGKTEMARDMLDVRVQRGGYCVVFCMKPLEDETITREYADFVRWRSWKDRPKVTEQKVLLWPDVSKAKGNTHEILAIQRRVFSEAFDGLNRTGRWTVQIDEGLYAASPSFLNKAAEMAMGQAIGRSGRLTYLTLAQRPSHLPLILYSAASHVFAGRMREASDLKRLAELGGKVSARDLGNRISELDRHEFLWIPVATDGDPQVVNIRR
jgi:energy-coupling factor transporter ATP-binding protein EcfA2